jgi:hypothetical protein
VARTAPRKRTERRAVEPVGAPPVERGGAEPVVEVDGQPVPGEDHPLHAPALARRGLRGHRPEEGEAQAVPAGLRQDEEVLEEHRRTRQERAVGLEVQRVARGAAVEQAEVCLEAPPLAEAVAGQALARVRVGAHQLLVVGQRVDQRQQRRQVRRRRLAHLDMRLAARVGHPRTSTPAWRSTTRIISR